MAFNPSKCLRATDLPRDVTEDQLKLLFQNKRRQGGGPVENIILNTCGTSPWAVITFKYAEAVDIILGRGQTVTIDTHTIKVERYNDENKLEKPDKMLKWKQGVESRSNRGAMAPMSSQASGESLIPFEDDEHLYGNQMETVSDEELIKKTIKATVYDVWKSKQSYILYLEDDTVSQGSFDEDSLLLDCLNKKLYVTFDDEEGAQKTCEMEHDADSYFESVEMARHADFDIYFDRVSIHGFCVKRSNQRQLSSFIENLTQMRIKNIIQQDEPCSAIIQFYTDCEDIISTCWLMRTDFEGTKIMSSPVFKTKSVRVTSLTEFSDKKLLQRYLSNSRSGGGQIEDIWWDGKDAVVSFKSKESFSGVLTRSHELDGYRLTVEPYFHCLSKSAYLESMGEVRTANQNEDLLELQTKDILFFQLTDGLGSLQNEFSKVQMVLEAKNKAIRISGNTDNVTKAKLGVLKASMKISEKKCDISEGQAELLKNSTVHGKISTNLREAKLHAVFVVEDRTLVMYSMAPTDPEDVERLIKQEICEERKTLSDPNAELLFSSQQGQDYLSKVGKASNDCSSSGHMVKYDSSNNSLLVVAPEYKIQEIHRDIEAFMRENLMEIRTVKYSSGKYQYLKRFGQSMMSDILNKVQSDAVIKIEESNEGFQVKGKKEDVLFVEKKLIKLRDSLFVDTFPLEYFGIEEFLSETKWEKIKSVEDSLSCVVVKPAEQFPISPSLPGHPEPVVVATADIQSCRVHFVQGSLLGLKVDSIVNPVGRAGKLESKLGKELLKQGGQQIEFDLLRSSDSGPVVVTGSGNLDNCKSILHAQLPENTSTETSAIRTAMMACFEVASKNELVSIGFPTIGIGAYFKYSSLAVCIQTMQAIKEFISKDKARPQDIYLCDLDANLLSDLIDRFEKTFPSCNLELAAPLKSTPEKEVEHQQEKPFQKPWGRPKEFGHIKVRVREGEITKWKTDVMVITADKGLNLKKGNLAKLVLKHGGEDVQQELVDKYPDGIQAGEFAQSAGGKLKCKHIIYTCLSRWRGGSDQQTRQMQTLLEKILEAADAIPMQTIAVPALGTGNLQYPPDIVAQLFCQAISNFSKEHPESSLRTVDIVIYPGDQNILDAFKSQFTNSGVSTAGDRSFDDTEQGGEEGDAEDQAQGAKDGKTFTFSSVKLEITKGNILLESCDAIVNSIKDSMALADSGAVSRELLKKCGPALQTECDSQQASMEQIGIACTSAPDLPCKNIYHVSMDKFKSCWDKGVFEVLMKAEESGVKSIALPLLGAGAAKRHNLAQIKDKILAGIKKFGASGGTVLKDIRLVIFSQYMFDNIIGKSPGKNSSASKHSRSCRTSAAASKALPKVSTKLDLKIYAKNASHADKVKETLTVCFKEIFRSHQERNEKIRNLTEEQIQDIKHYACLRKVHVAVKPDEGICTMSSFFSMLEVMSKLNQLLVHAVESNLTDLHMAMAPAIVWQFKSSKDKWTNFEPLSNSEIERQYKKNVNSFLLRDSKNRTYKLDLKAMKEFSCDEAGNCSGNGVTIRRFDRTRAGEPLPKRWESMGPNENLKLVQVHKGSEEFSRVEKQFVKGGISDPIKTVQRIQNKALYQQYMVKKRELDSRNGANFENEKRLFHGTCHTSIAAINANGFNRNYSGVNATAYGEGAYFAVQSSYSRTYCQPDSAGVRHMYLARVLVGKSTRSQSSWKHLPNQPGTNTPYDSGTDGNNVMYIIFHDAQTYPEYIVEF